MDHLDDLLRAVALLLVMEGFMPFLSPRRFREALLRAANLPDRLLRIFGLVALIGGVVLLQVANP